MSFLFIFQEKGEPFLGGNAPCCSALAALARLQGEKCFCRRTRRRQKQTMFLLQACGLQNAAQFSPEKISQKFCIFLFTNLQRYGIK
jgi:hypothetical protein